MYIYKHILVIPVKVNVKCRCVSATPIRGVPVALYFDYQFEFAKFLHRQNQSVQKTPLICTCPVAGGRPCGLMPMAGHYKSKHYI